MDDKLDLTGDWCTIWFEHEGIRYEFHSIKDALEGIYELGFNEGLIKGSNYIRRTTTESS